MSRVDFIKRVIDSQIGQIHSICDVAQQAGRSPETIRKEFARAERIPLSEYMRRKRIEEAEQLLLETDLTCCEVAYAVGFSRAEAAMRTFKRITGLTMKCFRQERNGVKTTSKPGHEAHVAELPLKSANFC